MTADTTPNETPVTTARAVEDTANLAVRGSLSINTCVTGLLFRNDLPRSKVSSPLKKSVNCSHNGLFKPSSSLILWMVSGSPVLPTIIRAGSPGTMLVSMNTTAITPITTGTAASSLFIV